MTYFPGMMKCSRDQSSLREFCRGVPVISSRWLDLNSIMVLYRRESSFFSRWASSTPVKAQPTPPRNDWTHTCGWVYMHKQFIQTSNISKKIARVASNLVLKENLVCCENDVKFQSLGMDMHPLMRPDLLREKSTAHYACITRKCTRKGFKRGAKMKLIKCRYKFVGKMHKSICNHTIFLLLMSPK